MNKSKLIRWSVPIAVLVLLWVIPTPEGLTPAAWHMFAIFAATIAGILAAPVASGALMFIALAITYFTNTLPLNDVLKGFASGTVWMIFSAYVLSLGFVQSGLGRRIAYRALSLLDNAVNKLRRKTDVSVGIEHVVNLVLSEGRCHFRCTHQHILEGNFLLIGLHAGLVDD